MSEEQADPATETPATEEPSSSDLEESGPGEIGDDELPEDLQPTKDNPLARHPGETGDDDDQIGASTEGADSENPSANMAYSEGESNAPSDDAPGESG
jgi:hypothetical protein